MSDLVRNSKIGFLAMRPILHHTKSYLQTFLKVFAYFEYKAESDVNLIGLGEAGVYIQDLLE